MAERQRLPGGGRRVPIIPGGLQEALDPLGLHLTSGPQLVMGMVGGFSDGDAELLGLPLAHIETQSKK